MKILVTGAAGFIGSQLIPTLLEKGHSVCGLLRYSTTGSDSSKRRTGKLEALQNSKKGAFQILRSEDYKTLPELLKKFAPEICVHLAGRSWVRESIGWPELYVDANYRTTVGLVEALHRVNCRRVVFASTMMVYGKDAPLPYSEEILGSTPASPYGASKLACEVLLNSYHALHKMEVVNLRIFSVYGPDMRQDCVPYLLGAAMMKGKPFTVFGDGSSVRDYVEVRDVLRVIEAACQGNQSHAALNVGSGFGTTLMELIQLMEQALGKKADIVHKPVVPGELPLAIPDITNTVNKLNWEPQISIEEGIKRLADWFKSPDCVLPR